METNIQNKSLKHQSQNLFLELIIPNQTSKIKFALIINPYDDCLKSLKINTRIIVFCLQLLVEISTG